MAMFSANVSHNYKVSYNVLVYDMSLYDDIMMLYVSNLSSPLKMSDFNIIYLYIIYTEYI